MLSGQLVPTSTSNNFVGQSEFFINDDPSSYNVEFNNKNTKQEKEEQNVITATETTTIISSDKKGIQGFSNNNECQKHQTELLNKKNIISIIDPSLTTTTIISNSKLNRFSGNSNSSGSSSGVNGDSITTIDYGNIDKEFNSGNNSNNTTNIPLLQQKSQSISSSFPFKSINNYTTNGSNSNGYNNGISYKNLNTNLLSSSAVPLAIVTNINSNNNNNNNLNNNNSINNNNNYNNSNNNININNDNNNNNNLNNTNDATGRSAALERAYVHDVYANCEETTGPIRPRVAQFLSGLEPGSIVCDVGCGNGRYLTACNPFICTIGVDRCYRLTKVAKEKGSEVALCDNLELPFRDESFDAVLSLAVVHHFATTERRVGAIRELARILRIGGRVIISVWALEQRHRRFESQDVLIPWQPPKNRTINYSDEEDEDDYLPPYHAYTEDSTNSSRSAGDGDSSSLSSSSPGESCYSFVRRAIQKLAGGRKHPWFLDSWTSKDTKNDSSLDYEDAKDLPIELRRLEDFEDFPDPPLSAGLKSRSLGSILNPPPKQIVRSRSSVPSLGSCGINAQQQQQQQIFFPEQQKAQSKSHHSHHHHHHHNQNSDNSSSTIPQQSSHLHHHSSINPINTSSSTTINTKSPQKLSTTQLIDGSINVQHNTTNQLNISSINCIKNNDNDLITGGISTIINNGNTTTQTTTTTTSTTLTTNTGRRPKLIKQKQSLCDEEYQLPDNPFHMINNNNNISNISNNLNNSSHNLSSTSSNNTFVNNVKLFQKQNSDSKLLLRKQSSLNEELMAENRLREKERVRKRIQKQMSLNEAFLCRSVFTKRLQIIREGFTTKLKTSTGSLERVTKNSLIKIMKNFQTSQFTQNNNNSTNNCTTKCNNNSNDCNIGNINNGQQQNSTQQNQQQINQQLQQQQQLNPLTGKCTISRKNSCQTLVNAKLAMQHCIQAGTHSTSGGICTNCNNGSGGSGSGGSSNSSNNSNDDPSKPRRHSRESGSDSSKDSSLQSDTSIESEDSFASVIFIPKIENQQQQQHQPCNHQQQQQQLYHQYQKNSSSTNSSSSNGTCNCRNYHQNDIKCNNNGTKYYQQHNNNYKSQYILPPMPTSPLIMPCPPTPAHSPAAQTSNSSTIISPPPLQIVSGMLLSPPNLNLPTTTPTNTANNIQQQQYQQQEIFNPNNITITEQIGTKTTTAMMMMNKIQGKKSNDHFTFDDDHIKQQQIDLPSLSSSSQLINNESLDKLNDIKTKDLKLKKTLSSSTTKITRQTIRDLPIIPKFRKQQSLQITTTTNKSSLSSTLNNHFPIIRRSSAIPNVTKLMSLELFNPETDDLDSDSSEPSSPDSIDSVINTKPLSSSSSVEKDNNKLIKNDKILLNDNINDDNNADDDNHIIVVDPIIKLTKLQQTKEYHSLDLPNISKINNSYDDDDLDMKNKLINQNNNNNNTNQDDELLFQKYSNNKDNLIVNSSDLISNKKLLSTIKKNDTKKNSINNHKKSSSSSSRQEFVDFAEQLSAQLLKRIDETNRKYDIQYNDDDDNHDCNNIKKNNVTGIDQFSDDPYSNNKYGNSNNDHHHHHHHQDLTDWREELRERRLNLANLSTQPSLQQSPISSSTSSLSSQTRSFTIHEEDEDGEAIAESVSYSLSSSNYYDNNNHRSNKNLKYKYRNNNFPLDYRYINPETAYLIQDGDSREDDDDDDDDINTCEHNNIILEEDEDEEDNQNDGELCGATSNSSGYCKRTSRNTIRCQDDSIESPLTNDNNIIGIASCSSGGAGTSTQINNNNTTNNNNSIETRNRQPIQSGESWALTNSSNSLDSPSQSGGSTTHHRYYHVFREGELDALINHHVTSLHIVSSYYERASWCVVAEKVQVWTI